MAGRLGEHIRRARNDLCCAIGENSLLPEFVRAIVRDRYTGGGGEPCELLQSSATVASKTPLLEEWLHALSRLQPNEKDLQSLVEQAFLGANCTIRGVAWVAVCELWTIFGIADRFSEGRDTLLLHVARHLGVLEQPYWRAIAQGWLDDLNALLIAEEMVHRIDEELKNLGKTQTRSGEEPT